MTSQQLGEILSDTRTFGSDSVLRCRYDRMPSLGGAAESRLDVRRSIKRCDHVPCVAIPGCINIDSS